MQVLYKRSILVGVSLCVMLGLGRYSATTGFGKTLDVGAFVSAILSSGSVAVGVIAGIQRFGWRFRVVRSLFGDLDPYVGGRWSGSLRSSFSDFLVEVPIVLEIQHRATCINVAYYDQWATSESVVAGFEARAIVDEHAHGRLFVVYHNVPTVRRFENFHDHYGVMDLRVSRDGMQIWGRYFNDPTERQTTGELVLHREGGKLLGRFLPSGEQAGVDGGDRLQSTPVRETKALLAKVRSPTLQRPRRSPLRADRRLREGGGSVKGDGSRGG